MITNEIEMQERELNINLNNYLEYTYSNNIFEKYQSIIFENLDKKQIEEIMKDLREDTNSKTDIINFEKCKMMSLDVYFPNKLRILNFSSCKLEKIPENIKLLDELEELRIKDCYLNSIENLSKNIKFLDVSYNQIKEINYDNLSESIVEFKITHNFLTETPPKLWINKTDYSQNEIEDKKRILTIFEDVYWNVRELDRDRNRVIQNFNNIYNNPNQTNNILVNNNQTVHLSSINNSVSKSIKKILDETKNMVKNPLFKKDLFNKVYGNIIYRNLFYQRHLMFIESNLNDKSIHSIHKVTYGELLEKMWFLIEKYPERKYIYKRLKTEIGESIGYCFTGRINRLVNVMSGYLDGINVGLSEEEEMQMLIQSLIKKLAEKKITKNNAKDELTKIFDQFNYDKNKRESWFEALDDYADEDNQEEKKDNIIMEVN